MSTRRLPSVTRVAMAAVAVLLLCPSLHAGAAFFPGRLDGERFTRGEGAQGPCYAIRYSSTAAKIDSDAAAFTIRETFAGPEKAVRCVCVVPLCPGTDLAGVTLTAGRPGDPQLPVPGARKLSAEEAQRVYEALARGGNTVSVLALTGRPAVVVPEFELQGAVELVLEFPQKVREQDGVRRVACPMPSVAWARGPVERLSISAAVRSPEPLRAMFSPTHAAAVQRKGLHEAAVSVKAERWSGRDDFRLLWVADRDDLGLRVFAHRDEGDDDGYFLLVGNPTGSAGREKLLDKDLLFVLDTSGSMRGEKIEQARSAIAWCLRRLNPGDRFNIVTFGTEVESFRDAPVENTAENLAAAEKHIEAVVATGRTNIGGALAKALGGLSPPPRGQQGTEPAKGARPRIAIFLTDGTPTAGELVPEKIIEAVKQANTSATKVFVMGMGHDVNAHLLDKLAEATDGSSEYAGPGEELDAKIAALYDRLSHPVLSGVAVSFGDLKTSSVYPQKLPVLFKGSEIMIAGRYRDGGPASFTVSGTLSGKPAEYVCRVDLPRAAGGKANDFVPPLWAARKIGYLLQEIRLHGENKELLEEVVRLSKRFGIVTEYTEFLATASGEMTAEAAVNEARRQIGAARAQQAGQWAVNQAFNDRQLQQRAVASREANTYRDRRGNVVSGENIGQAGRRVFYLRDGQWVDAEEPGKRPVRVVQLFSPEYFVLLRASPEFAEAQQLGWAMSINVGSDRVVIERDGKQKDEQLRASAPPPELQQPRRQVPRGPLQQLPQLQQAPLNQAPLNQRENQRIQAQDRNEVEADFRNQAPVQARPGLPRGLNQNLFPRNQALAGRGALGRAVHQPFVEPVTAAKIRTAVDDAVACLRGLQDKDGAMEAGYGTGGGCTALAALAILAAGADPASDDGLKRALSWLARQEPNNTYVRAIRANVWEYALRKAPYDEAMRGLLKADYEWLLAALGDKEGWRYQKESTDWDNSCTQYGVLGVWAAARAGFEPGDKFWVTLSRHFRSCQCDDGGWSYTGRSGSTPNMATAGLASMFLVFDMHHAKTSYRRDNPRAFAEGEAADVLQSIERGMNWLGKAQGNKEDGYYLYGIERTGVASGRKTIGGEDWFARGALAVLQAQGPDGSIPLGHWGGPAVSTAFCTLFLVYGGAPVAFNKLQHGDGQDWNLNPRDLANLTKSLWSAYERPLNWQIVALDGPAEDLAEAPILFLSGSKKAQFTDGQVEKLRGYVLRGGTILAEPSDHSEEFARSIEDLLRRMFPPADFPGCTLQRLADDHPIFTVIKQPWKGRPKLRGASDGSRTFFLLSDEYLGADWQANRTESDGFLLATNLLFYATDMGQLEGKFASILPASPAAKPREKTLGIARARHAGAPGAPRDWDAAAGCWTRLSPYARHASGCGLKESAPVALGKDSLEGVGLLHVTGRGPLRLSAGEQEALKKYVESGGVVLVDPYAGSPEFAASSKAALEAIFGEMKPLEPNDVLAEGQFEGGVDLSAGIGLKLAARQLLRGRGEQPQGQKLLVVRSGRRPAVLWSEFDLVAAAAGIENYRSLGYKPESARKIVGNLLAWLVAIRVD